MMKIQAIIILIFVAITGLAQEVIFFDEGTNSNFYDQGIVDVNNLGASTFEHTYPPGGSPTKWNDKVPCSTTAYKGSTSLKFNYKSSANGNWMVRIHRKDWSTADISGLDSISFFIYSENELPKTALPLIGVMTDNGSSDFDTLANYNPNVPASTWTQIKYPLAGLKGSFNLSLTKAIVFSQSEKNDSSRTVLIDEVLAFKNFGEVPPVTGFSASGYDSHAELNWVAPMANLTYRIYASFDGGQHFELRTETTETNFLDFVPEKGKNTHVIYRVVSVVQNKESEPVEKTAAIRDFSDAELMNMVQEYSFRYFWEGAHAATGMALERSNGSSNTAASGATGFGLMAMIVAHEREFRPKDEIKNRILLILNFLETCERHHGAWSHWYNADTKKTQPFGTNDDGGDMVETSFVAQALIALKNYFSGNDTKSVEIREKADQLWKEIDWNWYRQNNQNVIYWHWSPNVAFAKNTKVSGWNEALITYIMAASSPTHGIPKVVYTQGWARNGNMVKPNRSYYDYPITLANNWGGPLFWIHYSHLGINPHGLKDQYADYWQEHVNTAKIHYEYAKDNPLSYKNYSEKCWGLTASDDPDGYTAHKPMDNDNGTISPTAALASMPYTPAESMKALKYFYRERGSELFGKYGPYDAFNDSRSWVKNAYLGIDQGPIVVMIENFRTGLLWKNVMVDADVQAGLNKLGFQYEVDVASAAKEIEKNNWLLVYPNPAKDQINVSLNGIQYPAHITVFGIDGKKYLNRIFQQESTGLTLNCATLKSGMYILQVADTERKWSKKIVIKK